MRLWPLIIALLFPAKGIAQHLEFAHLNVADGLTHKSVLAVAQDSRGFIWLGTADGLNRYDSRRIKQYLADPRTKNSISSNNILSLLSDSRQNLWVGTTGGLHRYRPQTDDFEMMKLPVGSNGQDRHVINCIYEDRKHRLWVGTNSGLFLFPADGKPAIPFFASGGLMSNSINGILEDPRGNIWIGTGKGLNRFNGSSFENFLAGEHITALAEDEHHTLWVGLQQKGLYHFQNKELVAVNNIRRIKADGKGNLWIGTQDGLYAMDIKSRRLQVYRHQAEDPKSLSQNSIYALFIDRDQTLWVGTYFGGANTVSTSLFTIWQPGISSNVISAFARDEDDNLWIGTEGGGLNFWDRRQGKVVSWQHQPDNPAGISSNLIKTVYRDRDGNIWAGTSHGGGINVLSGGSFLKYLNTESAQLEIRVLTEDHRGLLWVGTNAGIRFFRRNGVTLTPDTGFAMPPYLQSAAIHSLLCDSKNRVWIGSEGLFLLDKNAGGIQRFHLNDQSTRVNSLFEDAAGNIWIGTEGKGLVRYDAVTQKMVVYTEVNGLANNNVYSILQDQQGDMWIGTRNGISCLHAATGAFKSYTISDGLAGNDCNRNACIRLGSDEIMFGGFNGFTGFYPDRIVVNAHKPVARITGLRLFNTPVAFGDEDRISFDHTQNVFTIEFAALNFIHPEKNRYAYKIDKVDNDWNYTVTPSATYNNLQPGSYLFLAKGSNNDGVWSEPVSILVVVHPPWWRTWWAYTLYALAFGALVFFIIRFFFLRALLRKDKILTALKLNFFTNISHEIRTYLSLITGPVEKLLLHKKEQDVDKEQLEMIRKNSEGLLQLVNELMDFRKAETGNLVLHIGQYNVVSFAQSICQSFQDISQSKNIVTDFLPSAPVITAWFDREQMKKVLFNLLSNAYKFTPTGGYVSITIEEKNDAVVIRVADNGKGIASENLSKLFDNYFQENDYGQQNTGYGIGLAFSKTIVELHKGELSVESASNTVFSVLLRKGNAHFDKDKILAAHPSEEEDIHYEHGLSPVPELTFAPGHGGSKTHTLLVVEDNAELRSFIAGALLPYFHVLEAPNGLEGFELATTQIPDIIISDVMMPEMDGYTLCRQLKTDERTNHIPVVLLTARSSVTDHKDGLQTGADVYLTKPFSIQLLQLQVQNLLSSAEKMRQRYNRALVVTADVTLAPEDDFISRIVLLAEENMANPDFDVEMICRKIGMSQTVLYKKLKAMTQMTVNEIVKNVRMKKAAALISQQKYTVYEIADMVGYSDTKYFSREFKKEFGVSPSEYKKVAGR